MTFATLQSNIERVVSSFNTLVIDSAMEHNDTIVELNRAQLWDGERADGKSIVPRYSQDPYFKTKQAAAEYAAWKQRITPSPVRDSDTPNLYINGYFHRSIIAEKEKDTIKVSSGVKLGQELDQKYKNIFGLNKGSIAELKPELLETLLNNVRDELHAS